MLGVIIGDAMGGPVETLESPEAIRQLLGGPVTGFLDPREVRTDDVPEECGPGSPSDDWQQTHDVGMSIVECKGFNLEHSIKQQIDSWKKSPYGVGGTTRNAFREMDAWFRSGGKEGRSPHTPPPFVKGKGAGNGPAMKVVPLAYLCSFQWPTKLEDNTFALGRSTHGDPRASVAAYLVARLHSELIARTWFKQSHSTLTSVLLMFHPMWNAEELNPLPDGERPFSRYFEGLFEGPERNTVRDLASTRTSLGTSSLCWESVPFSIGVFLRHPRDFRAGILEAVNAGGDTDTNASIAGGLIGAEVGEDGVPPEWRSFHPRFEEAIALADALTDLIADRAP